MKVFQMEGKPNIIEFTNYERIPEKELFQKVFLRLKQLQGVKIGQRQTGPSEDTYQCLLGDSSFTLIYDIDYGTSIYAEDKNTVKKLIDFFG